MHNRSIPWHMPWQPPPSHGLPLPVQDIYGTPLPLMSRARVNEYGYPVMPSTPQPPVKPPFPVSMQQSFQDPMNQWYARFGVSKTPVTQPVAPTDMQGFSLPTNQWQFPATQSFMTPMNMAYKPTNMPAMSGVTAPESDVAIFVRELINACNDAASKEPNVEIKSRISSLGDELNKAVQGDPSEDNLWKKVERVLWNRFKISDPAVSARIDQSLRSMGYTWNLNDAYEFAKKMAGSESWGNYAMAAVAGIGLFTLMALWAIRPRTVVKTGAWF